MSFFLGIGQTIILLGAVQGFIISTLLFFSTVNRRPNRLLAGLIFLIALASLRLYGLEKNWFHLSMFASIVDAFVPMIVVMPLGPLLFFYVKASLNPAFKLTKKDRLHFCAVIIDIVPQLTAAIFVIGVLTYQFRNNPGPWGLFIDTYNVYSDLPRWFSLSLYVWFTARYLAKMKTASPDAVQHQAGLFKWLQQFVRVFAIFQVIWFLYLVPYVIPQYTDKLLGSVGWYPIYVPLAILIYWLGIKGYLIAHRSAAALRNIGSATVLPVAVAEQAMAALTKAMETDKLYLDPNLTVSLLATHTSLTPKTISAVLNQHLHKNFNEFVNEYRVQAITEKMQQAAFRHLTIAGLAYECGFNSLSTFQRAFKTIKGVTPKEYLSKKA
jgi:AraC-like DNA-binding protein